MFEHCSLRFRVRMAAALKRLHLQETVVLDDDTDTMVGLVGKRVIPILVKDDGQPMLESMHMVTIVAKTGPLTMPRYPLLGLPEFATIAALDHYKLRKHSAFGDFGELRANTRAYLKELMPDLEQLDRLIESPTAVNGKVSRDDIRVLPLLRSAAVVKGLRFPRKVRDYFETMMDLIGYQPLPVVWRRICDEASARSRVRRGPSAFDWVLFRAVRRGARGRKAGLCQMDAGRPAG
jgi:glutaredoxin 2